MWQLTKHYLKTVNVWYDNQTEPSRFWWMMSVAVPGIIMVGSDTAAIGLLGMTWLAFLALVRLLYFWKML